VITTDAEFQFPIEAPWSLSELYFQHFADEKVGEESNMRVVIDTNHREQIGIFDSYRQRLDLAEKVMNENGADYLLLLVTKPFVSFNPAGYKYSHHDYEFAFLQSVSLDILFNHEAMSAVVGAILVLRYEVIEGEVVERTCMSPARQGDGFYIERFKDAVGLPMVIDEPFRTRDLNEEVSSAMFERFENEMKKLFEYTEYKCLGALKPAFAKTKKRRGFN